MNAAAGCCHNIDIWPCAISQLDKQCQAFPRITTTTTTTVTTTTHHWEGSVTSCMGWVGDASMAIFDLSASVLLNNQSPHCLAAEIVHIPYCKDARSTFWDRCLNDFVLRTSSPPQQFLVSSVLFSWIPILFFFVPAFSKYFFSLIKIMTASSNACQSQTQNTHVDGATRPTTPSTLPVDFVLFSLDEWSFTLICEHRTVIVSLYSHRSPPILND